MFNLTKSKIQGVFVLSFLFSTSSKGGWVTNYRDKSSAVFWIIRGNDTHLGSDLQTGIKNINITLMKKYENKSYKIIEPAAISAIDGKIAATFIHSFVESSDGLKIEEVQQIWLVYVGTKKDYYLLGFRAPLQLFTGLENSQARANFIKSLKFIPQIILVNGYLLIKHPFGNLQTIFLVKNTEINFWIWFRISYTSYYL